jgi:hypothetical protein
VALADGPVLEGIFAIPPLVGAFFNPEVGASWAIALCHYTKDTLFY